MPFKPRDAWNLNSSIDTEISEQNDINTNSTEGEVVTRKALIYINYEYQLPGTIRDEYIARMQLAMADARMLGVSQNYLETSLHPLIFGKRTGAGPDEVRSPWPQL